MMTNPNDIQMDDPNEQTAVFNSIASKNDIEKEAFVDKKITAFAKQPSNTYMRHTSLPYVAQLSRSMDCMSQIHTNKILNFVVLPSKNPEFFMD